MYNYVVLKVKNVHQAKVKEHERELRTRSHSFSGLLHGVNTFFMNFKFIYYSSKTFLKCKVFLLIYAMYNLMNVE